MIDEILKFKEINKLKSTYRSTSVIDDTYNRKENTAEHTWSALMLADYLFEKYGFPQLNRARVFDLLLYHDLVEAQVGDTPLDPEKPQIGKKEREAEGSKVFAAKLPSVVGEKFLDCFAEFEECVTLEAKFANAVDKLDAEIHELDYKQDWKGWSAEFLLKTKRKYMTDFPELQEFFQEILTYLIENGYFDQE